MKWISHEYIQGICMHAYIHDIYMWRRSCWSINKSNYIQRKRGVNFQFCAFALSCSITIKERTRPDQIDIRSASFFLSLSLSLSAPFFHNSIKKSISKVWWLSCPSINQSNQSRDQSSTEYKRTKKGGYPKCHPLPPHYHWTTSLLPNSYVMFTATFVTPSSLYEPHNTLFNSLGFFNATYSTLFSKFFYFLSLSMFSSCLI